MQNDLRNLATAQEIYFDKHDKYALTPAEAGLALSRGVEITITSDDLKVGYTAVATRAGTDISCWLNRWGGEGADDSRVTCSDESDGNGQQAL